MEKKMKRIPFDLGMAKEITKGEREGMVVTRAGYPVRILCFDRVLGKYPDATMVCLVRKGNDDILMSDADNHTGKSMKGIDTEFDLFLEVPEISEEPEFKPGDTVVNSLGSIGIFRKVEGNLVSTFVCVMPNIGNAVLYDQPMNAEGLRCATGQETDRFRGRLIVDLSMRVMEMYSKFLDNK